MQGGTSSTILWGARAIAADINKSPNATFHLLERGLLPARKVGRQWTADREVLRAYLAGQVGPIAK